MTPSLSPQQPLTPAPSTQRSSPIEAANPEMATPKRDASANESGYSSGVSSGISTPDTDAPQPETECSPPKMARKA